MKKVKITLPIVAFAIALFATAFTTAKKAPQKFASLYWYQTTYDAQHPNGTILSSSSFYVQDEKTNVSSPCLSGTNKDCLRGFTSQLTAFPENGSGADQIKKP